LLAESELKYHSEDIIDLKEILDIEKLSSLLEQLYSATGLANSIVDLKGNIMHKAGWQSICTEFHRKHPISSQRCLESDTILANKLKEKEKYSIYICHNGMVDAANPIIIDGVHVANFFIGQFFFETPDKDFFIKQAEELGFDKDKYMQALEECRVYDKETIFRFLDFFSGLIEMVGEAALKTIKQKKQAAELVIAGKELLASENYYRTIFEDTGAATMIIEEDMTITMVNEECQRLLGYAKEDLIGKKWTDFIPGDLVENTNEYHHTRRVNPAAVPRKYQTRLIDWQGKYKDGLLAVDIIPGTTKSVATFIDFTVFNRIDRALKATNAVNMAMLRAENEEELLRIVCQKVVEVGGYCLAWIGYVQADQQQTLQPIAYAGKDNGYLAKLDIALQDPKRGRGPTGTAIRTGQLAVSRDFKKDDTFKPWLKDALRRGFKSSIVLPLMDDNKAFGALSIYSTETDQFDSDEEKLLTEMAGDLTYGIMSLRAHIDKNQTAQELEKSLEKMRRILMQAVASLGATLDTRDPYTAGHQRRVGELATAIAEEMGFSKDQIEGISVAGNLHDIGKINVPSEILNKPGKLSDIEVALIKTHPQAGYEIVKDIEFPWPVGEVILQHHERMNGSGYIRGLAGEDILMEARIMGVADVVEAMASHRPYQPALGIDKALEEISQNRGILYDPDVVDACLKLFKEQSFKLE